MSFYLSFDRTDLKYWQDICHFKSGQCLPDTADIRHTAPPTGVKKIILVNVKVLTVLNQSQSYIHTHTHRVACHPLITELFSSFFFFLPAGGSDSAPHHSSTGEIWLPWRYVTVINSGTGRYQLRNNSKILKGVELAVAQREASAALRKEESCLKEFLGQITSFRRFQQLNWSPALWYYGLCLPLLARPLLTWICSLCQLVDGAPSAGHVGITGVKVVGGFPQRSPIKQTVSLIVKGGSSGLARRVKDLTRIVLWSRDRWARIPPGKQR